MTAKWQYKEAYEAALVTARELRAENAKLREDLEDQEGYDQMLRDRLRQQTELCVETEAKNEKLRELAAEMYPCAKAYIQEWLMVGGIDSKSYDWYLRLRELGVEVDE